MNRQRSIFDSGKFIPIVGTNFYKVILVSSAEYDSTRRTTVDKKRGISYLYGIEEGVGGAMTEVIEVWFVNAKWTASTVRQWMERHADSLPAPTGVRRAPEGRPAMARSTR